MNIPPGTTYTITNGFNIAVIPLLEQSHSLADKDMQGAGIPIAVALAILQSTKKLPGI